MRFNERRQPVYAGAQVCVSADNINYLETDGIIKHSASPQELLQAMAWTWILLHGWNPLLWKYPVPTVHCRLCVPAAVKARAVQELNYLLRGYFPLNGFKAGFPHTAEPVIIVRLCDTVAGTPADDAHAGRTALTVPDLVGPFPETVLLSHHSCF